MVINNNPSRGKMSPRSTIWGQAKRSRMGDLCLSAPSATFTTMVRSPRGATSATGKRLMKTRTMTKPTSKDDLHGTDNTTHSANLNAKFKIGDEFFKILRNNTFNGVEKGNIDHMEKVLEISEWIKIPNVDHNQIRLNIFLISLSGHAKE
ncbi:hypothetical protein Tco_0953757 [Tanacetum coccineum]|uniref:Uncharacterized protein n=1 Tax=Tanacetum coccineum TaxID=301880 RepID=A0ABQ5E0S2_9ASTR